MENSIQSFKPEDLREKISNRIKSTFAELIPEKDWNDLVDKEIQSFIKTDLPNIVKAELTKRYAGEIKIYLDGMDFSTVYNNGQYEPSQAVKGIIKDLAPDLIASLFGNIIQNAIFNLRNSLPHY